MSAEVKKVLQWGKSRAAVLQISQLALGSRKGTKVKDRIIGWSEIFSETACISKQASSFPLPALGQGPPQYYRGP